MGARYPRAGIPVMAAAEVDTAMSWLPAVLVLAGTAITAGLGFLGTVLVKRMSRGAEVASARKTEAEARRLEAETGTLAAREADDNADRDLQRMQKTLLFAFDTLDRLTAQVASQASAYEQQIAQERAERNAQFAKHVEQSDQRINALQEQADRRFDFMRTEVQELRDELAAARGRVRQHRPWDERVARLVRDRLDSEFPDPPEL